MVDKFHSTCFEHVPDLLAVTKEQGNEHLIKAVDLYLELLKAQEAVIKTMAQCKKPVSMNFISDLATAKKKAFFDMGKAGRAVGIHLRVFEDAT